MDISAQQRCDKLFKDAFALCYEDNPARIGWERHTIDSDVIITNPNHIQPEAYYLPEVYLSTELQDVLFNITEGFTAWLETYKSGRTSLHNMLTVYTIDNLEKILSGYEAQIALVHEAKNKFIAEQT